MKLFEKLFLDDKMTVELMFFTDKRKKSCNDRIRIRKSLTRQKMKKII